MHSPRGHPKTRRLEGGYVGTERAECLEQEREGMHIYIFNLKYFITLYIYFIQLYFLNSGLSHVRTEERSF